MTDNYFKTAGRSLSRNKTFTILNITGLSIGLACSLLIALYVVDESSYDRFHANADRIYRIDEQIKFGDFNYHGTQSPAVMGPTFAREFAQVEKYTRFKSGPRFVIQKNEEYIREDKTIYADSSLFDVFTLEMIAGNKNTALKEPHNLVITETIARKYFNSTNVIGRTLLVNGDTQYKITGVIKDIPKQSHFNFDLFVPLAEADDSRSDSWVSTNVQTYLLLKTGVDRAVFESQMNMALERYQSSQFKAKLNMSIDEFKNAGNYIRCSLMPLTDIHLHSHLSDELGINGSIEYVYIFSAIAIFILLIACINFMNLSTAHSANRAKEVGVRKVLGVLKSSLIAQFLIESFVSCLLSFMIATLLAASLLPWFNLLAGKEIAASVLFSPTILSGMLLMLITVSLVSGSYPAFFLSSFQPIKVLKGNLSMGFKGSALRSVLVVVQFTISVILMIGTLVIFNQIQYIRNKDLGFNKEQVLTLQNTYALNGNVKALKNELLRMPEVKSVTSSGFLPVNGARAQQGFTITPQFDSKNFTIMQMWSIDEQYLPTFQLQLKNGRNFSEDYPADSTAIIINETAAKLFAQEDPVNKKLYRITDLSSGKLAAYNIIGVIKDFNFNSLHEEVSPLVLSLKGDNGSMAIRMSGRNISSTLNEIRSRWKSMVSSEPFSYTFLDDEFNRQYNEDERRGQVFLLFSVLAIFIACLGLFGLVTFAVEQRVKEIAVRKVLGAGVPDIFKFLSRDFMKLVLLSICIASPIAWWMMNKWLEDFAYRTTIDWLVFTPVGVICLLIAFITISFQATKAAVAKPAKALRME